MDDTSTPPNFRVLPSVFEQELKDGYDFITEITKNTPNNSEKNKKLEEHSKTENYKRIIAGLLYGILYSNTTVDPFFQLLYLINKDNHDTLLYFLITLLDQCHMNLPQSVFDRIYLIFDKLAHMNNPKLTDIMILLCRCIYPGWSILNSPNILISFLSFIKSKINWILENTSPSSKLVGQVFIKILRLLTETHCYQKLQDQQAQKAFNDIVNEECVILSKLYTRSKEDVYRIGRELFRIIILIAQSDYEIIANIIDDISKSGNYYQILSKSYPITGYDPYVQVNIPPLMEKMVIYILTRVRKSTGNYARYVNWIINKFNIKTAIGETLLTDIARYIITCYNFYNNNEIVDNCTPRWILLGYFLMSIKNEILSSIIKQAIFFDWVIFNKDIDSTKLIEPGLQIIYYSAKDYPELTMEIIEYIDSYCEQFDKRAKRVNRRNVCSVFKLVEEKCIISVKEGKECRDLIMKEDKISPEIKRIYEELTKSEVGSTFGNSRKGSDDTQAQSAITNNSGGENYMQMEINQMNVIGNNDNTAESVRIEIPIEDESSVDNEFYISQSFYNLISPIAYKNFVNFRSRKTFISLIDDICKNFLKKSKSALESKLNSIDPMYIDFLRNFALFYLNAFKDEILFSSFPNDIQTALIYIQKNTSIALFEYAFKANSSEIFLLSDIIKKIFDSEGSIMIYFFIYIVFIFKEKNINEKACYNFIIKLFDYNQKTLKDTMHQFITLCVDNFNIESLNFFFQYGFRIFHCIFIDDIQLLLDIIIYANTQSINSICLFLMVDKKILIEKSIFKVIELSLDLNANEQNKLWDILKAQGRLQNCSVKEYIDEFLKMSVKVVNSDISEKSEFFYHFSLGLQNLFKRELCSGIETKVGSFVSLFEFNCVFDKFIYGVFAVLGEFAGKNMPMLFNLIIDEFIQRQNKDIEYGKEKMKNCINILNYFCLSENEKKKDNRIDTFRLFDIDNFTIEKLTAKIEDIIKNLGLQFDK